MRGRVSGYRPDRLICHCFPSWFHTVSCSCRVWIARSRLCQTCKLRPAHRQRSLPSILPRKRCMFFGMGCRHHEVPKTKCDSLSAYERTKKKGSKGNTPPKPAESLLMSEHGQGPLAMRVGRGSIKARSARRMIVLNQACASP